MTGLSRITGLVRDVAFAQILGSGLFADAFFVAFRIPNFFRRIFAEGAFSVAFVPVYSETETQGGEGQAKAFLDLLLGRLCVILFFVTAIGIIGAPLLVSILAPGFQSDPEKFQTTVSALRFTFPYLFFISLVAMAGGILNTHGRFAGPAATPILLNVCLLAAIVLLVPIFQNPAVALGVGVLIAGLVQLGFQLPFLHIERRLPAPRIRSRNRDDQLGREDVQKVFRLMLPSLFGVSVAQLNVLINTVLASFLITGSVSWLYYSDRLMEFPLGVFGIALATAILPTLSSQYSEQMPDKFSETLDWALRLACLISIPASVALVVLSEPLMITIFQYGKFSAFDASMSARSLVAFAAGLFAFVSVKVLAPGFFARQDTKTPVKAGVIAVIVNIAFSLLLIRPLGHVGLACATSIAGFTNAGLLLWWLRKKGAYSPLTGWPGHLTRIVLASTLMGLVLVFFVNDSKVWLDASVLLRVALMGQGILVGTAVYFLSLFMMGLRFWHLLRRPAPTETNKFP
jgi:putative peptidoglycan lipid II flippase